MNRRHILIVAILYGVMALAFIRCGTGGGQGSSPLVREITLDQAATAMGGQTALLAVNTQTVTASGEWFEPEQTFRPGDPPLKVSSFQYTLTQDFTNERLRYDWSRGILYPFAAALTYSEIINGNQGFVNGQDTPNGAVQASMLSVRTATMKKLRRLTSPLFLIQKALNDPTILDFPADEEYSGKQYKVISIKDEASPIRLFIDQETFLPAKADTVEDDPYYGNALYEVEFRDWRSVGGVMVPFQLTQRFTGLGRTVTMQTELRSDVRNNIQVAADAFDIPANLQSQFDPVDAARGEFMSMWFHRRQAIGLPGYADQSKPVIFTESSAGSGVWHVTGGSHHSLVVEMNDHLIVVEPPLYESRSQAVIAEIKKRFPGKQVRFIVVTHFHFDHGGAVRAYAAEGATVITGEESRQHFTKILSEPHTLIPDALQQNPKQITVTPVPAQGLQLTDGVRTVAVYPVQNTHAADMVIAQVPGPNLVFVSDLFSPSTPVPLTSLPTTLQAAFTQFGLQVNIIAGGHGGMAAVF